MPEAGVNWADIDAHIEECSERAFAFLAELIKAPSTLGHEASAQEIVAAELQRLGFAVERLGIPDGVTDHPAAGVPTASYEARYNVVGRRRTAGGPSLLLNGHIDVVPADAATWSSDPWLPVRSDGWLVGRGAGDMKSGFAIASLALGALDTRRPGWLRGDLTFLSAIEEEATGNGTLAAAQAGVLADAALLLEPTDLDLLLAGVGVLWVDIEVMGSPAHAVSANAAVNPILAALPVVEALRELERELNATHHHATGVDAPFASLAHPYNVNIGTFHSGDWPSSVPARAQLGVRVGFPRRWSAADAFDRLSDVVDRAACRDPWLAQHPPVLRMSGFRAEGYALDPADPLVDAVAAAHEFAHGSPPRRIAMGSTTDARFYLNQFGVPALAYGARTRNIHSSDEAVELASITQAARTLARFLVPYFDSPDVPMPAEVE